MDLVEPCSWFNKRANGNDIDCCEGNFACNSDYPILLIIIIIITVIITNTTN